MHLSITVWCRSVFPLRCLVQIPIAIDVWDQRGGDEGHTLIPGCLDMTQYEALFPTEIFGSESSIVSIQWHGKPITYAFISFFATARNDTVPWLSLSILNKPTLRRKFIALWRVFASGMIASACLEVITWNKEMRDRGPLG